MRSRTSALAALLLLAGCGTTVPQAPVGSAADSLGPTRSGSQVASQVGQQGTAPGTGPAQQPDGHGAPEPDLGAGSATSRPGAVGPPRPASPSTSPLTVGVTYINNEQTTQALGASDPATVTKQNVVRALVTGINARGGLAGRRLKTVEYEWNSQSGSWSQAAANACARFTQDAKVDLVLDNAFGTTGGFRSCLQKAGVMSLQSSLEGDDVSSRQATLHANSYGMTADRAYSSVLRGLSATSYLSRSSTLGVVVEACPETQRAWTRTLKPLVARLGLKAPVEASLSCTTSFASAAPAASAISNHVLRFRANGVDRVMFVSDNESVALLLFATAADSQGYQPGYALSSGAQVQALRSQLPSGQQPQLHGVGHQPFSDVDSATPTAVDLRCRDLARAGGLTVVSYFDYVYLVFECGPFLLLEAALQRGDARARSVADSVAALGSRFAGPGLLRGATRFGSDKHDGPELVRTFGYVGSCTCLRYSGPARPAG